MLELSNFLAGPICGMFLADLGAQVLKVERPSSGDEMRYWGENKDGVGLYYKVINRGKKSITLDLRTPFGASRSSSAWSRIPTWWWRTIVPGRLRNGDWAMTS